MSVLPVKIDRCAIAKGIWVAVGLGCNLPSVWDFGFVFGVLGGVPFSLKCTKSRPNGTGGPWPGLLNSCGIYYSI